MKERIKFYYSVVDERAGKRGLTLLSVSARYGVIPRDTIADGPSRAEDLSNYKVCRSGDIVLNRMSAYQGAVGRSSQTGIVSPDYLVLRPSSEVESRYLHYLFRSQWFVSQMTSRLRGIGSSDNGGVRTPRINPEDLGDISVDLPSFARQSRIADFLDAETARIDRIIEIRQQQSTLHAQRFTQLVDGIVAADNDALAEIGYSKGSGAWGVGKISRLFAVIPGFAFPSEGFVQVGDGIRLLRGINVAPGRIDWEVETVAWDLESSPVDRRFHLRLDDLVVGMDRPWITGGTRAALVRQGDLPSLLLQRVACIRSRSTATTRYLQWVLGSSHFQAALEGETTGVSVPHISGDQISAFTYLLPPPEEQMVLAALLQHHSYSQVSRTELVNQQLAVLAERRQALQTAAVTGQIDITTAQGAAV